VHGARSPFKTERATVRDLEVVYSARSGRSKHRCSCARWRTVSS